MTIVRSLFVAIVAVGLVVTLGRASFGRGGGHGGGHEGHASHGKSEHKPAHEGHHEEHHGEHHDEHHDGHHEEHHDAHPGEHRDEHHDDHHDWRRDDHHADHRDWHHDEHYSINHRDWYRHEWWHHQLSWHNRPWRYWWHHPTVNEIAAWSAGWNLADPIYYDYGPDGNVVYRDNQVYVNDSPVGTAAAYAQSAITLAAAGVATETSTDQADEWLPLGTFAVLQANGDSQPSQTLQLAMNKNGTVSGVLFDLVKDTSTPIHGSLERATQRVAFDLGAKSGLVAETGFYNLTKDQVTLLVHKGKEQPLTYTLVRFQSPPASDEAKDVTPLTE